MSKKITKKQTIKKKKGKGAATNGALWAIGALGVIAIFGTVTAGGILPVLPRLQTAPSPGPQYSCCDSGDGTKCQPEGNVTQTLGKTFQYRGETYALLKSNIVQSEVGHTKPGRLVYGGSDKVAIYDNGVAENEPKTVFINTSDTSANYSGRWINKTVTPTIDICAHGKDLIGIPDQYEKLNGAPCYGLDNDQIIYVCTDPTPGACDKPVNPKTTPFDAYYRITKNGQPIVSPGQPIPIPSAVSSWCPKPSVATAQVAQQVIGIVTPGGRRNLQLETFQIKQQQQASDWLGAWCKPAINLYPTEKTTVHVTVQPKGHVNLTIPQYPQNGWTVTAYPDGKIEADNQTFPYLYYEAAIEDKYIQEPKEGYVVAQDELNTLFTSILPQLGLSDREQKQFSDYWLKALPKSPYYFVGVIPQSQINTMAPLTISPKPDSLLRVTLYFKVLENNDMKVTAPNLGGFERKGFTVTEWGGLVKTDKTHPFTCLM